MTSLSWRLLIGISALAGVGLAVCLAICLEPVAPGSNPAQRPSTPVLRVSHAHDAPAKVHAAEPSASRADKKDAADAEHAASHEPGTRETELQLALSATRAPSDGTGERMAASPLVAVAKLPGTTAQASPPAIGPADIFSAIQMLMNQNAGGAQSQPPLPPTSDTGSGARGTTSDSLATPPSGGGSGPTIRMRRIADSAGAVSGEGDDELSIQIQDNDIREVLELLSEQGGINILASKSVSGKVSASLNNVSVQTALDAILKSTGHVARREGNFIYVGTTADFAELDRSQDKIGTRVYRPDYVTATELQKLITPMLTTQTGISSVTTPAEGGIGSDATSVGGDSFSDREALLVQDFETILRQVDEIVAQIDQRPAQVAIEAMILSVRLNDELSIGLNWDLLRQQTNIRFGIGDPPSLNTPVGSTPSSTAPVDVEGGLTFAFLDSNLGVFLDALETIGDTNVIATPRLMVLNKQRAEILIGAELGYISTTVTETSTAQSVEFLEVGAQLRLRPFVSSDGMIRMEVHPELSTGAVRTVGGLTLPDKEVAQVTTNVMVKDGSTVIIGGLMREDLTTTTSQLPFLGNLPAVGWLFRTKTEEIEKREILVLITPTIVCDELAAKEGDDGAREFHRRQAIYADKMSPLGKRHLARHYLHKAQSAWQANNQRAALHWANKSIQFDPLNRAAIDFKADVLAGNHFGDHSGGSEPAAPEWLFDDYEELPSASEPAVERLPRAESTTEVTTEARRHGGKKKQ